MPPLAADLEADRLRHRERRLLRALAMLEARASAFVVDDRPVPAALAATIDGFRDDLAASRARLAAEEPGGAPASAA